jgi:hypothetical protein
VAKHGCCDSKIVNLIVGKQFCGGFLTVFTSLAAGTGGAIFASVYSFGGSVVNTSMSILETTAFNNSGELMTYFFPAPEMQGLGYIVAIFVFGPNCWFASRGVWRRDLCWNLCFRCG